MLHSLIYFSAYYFKILIGFIAHSNYSFSNYKLKYHPNRKPMPNYYYGFKTSHVSANIIAKVLDVKNNSVSFMVYSFDGGVSIKTKSTPINYFNKYYFNIQPFKNYSIDYIRKNRYNLSY